jgi:hypothetical protein
MIGKKGGQFLSSMGTPATASGYNKPIIQDYIFIVP